MQGNECAMDSDTDDGQMEVVEEDGCMVVQALGGREMQSDGPWADALQLFLLIRAAITAVTTVETLVNDKGQLAHLIENPAHLIQEIMTNNIIIIVNEFQW